VTGSSATPSPEALSGWPATAGEWRRGLNYYPLESGYLPLNLLDAYENPEKFEDKAERVIFLSGAIPTPATVGYERLRHLIVKKVNGVEIASMKNLISAFEKADENNLHSIEFMEEDFTIYLDENISTAVDSALLQRGLNRLSRAE
jgi:hypothetical protein